MARSGEQNKKLLFIGGGNIAGAVACGLVEYGGFSPECITVYDVDRTKLHKFKDRGMNVAESLASASCDADFVFIAVKPNIVSSAINDLKNAGVLENAVVVTFAAGVSISRIVEFASREIPVIRAMPNTPVAFGSGAIAVCKNALVTKRDFEYICRLFSSVANVQVVEEDVINAVVAVGGSAPAYVYLFVKSMLDGAEILGLPRETSLPMILSTIKGSCTMIDRSEKSIELLISDVSSPNGTTVAAMKSFQDSGFSDSVVDAMKACYDRAVEIASEL